MARTPIKVVRATFSLEEIANALRISASDALEKFRDPRVASWFAEIWGETLFGYKRHPSSNFPGSDARLALGNIGRFEISVRSFNNRNIKFQKSKFIGSGRQQSVTPDDLIESVEAVERIVIVDLRRFPVLDFYPIDSKDVLRRIRKGGLTLSGLTPRRFDEWIGEEFEVSVIEMQIPIPDPPEATLSDG